MHCYRSSLIFAVLLHLGLLLLVVFSPSIPTRPNHPLIAKTVPIHALTLNATEVAAAVAKIERDKKSEQHKAQQALQRLKKQVQESERHKQKITAEITRQRKQQQALKLSLAEQQKQLALSKQKTQKELKKLQQQKVAALEKQHAEKVTIEAEKKKQAQAEAKARAEVHARENKVVNRYKAMIVQAIAEHWLVPPQVERQMTCVVRARLAPDGTVLSVVIVQKSGSDALDRSARAAVYKASPLPVPMESKLFERFRDLQLTVRPEGIIRV